MVDFMVAGGVLLFIISMSDLLTTEKAHEEKADLIILGSRGVNRIRAFLFGNVSQKVVTYAKCSVLVIKNN
jgi:nucleotide-binding universal stress UspA family protein